MAKTWQVVLATIAIFVAGIVTGGASALGVVKWLARHPRIGMPGAAMFGPRPGRERHEVQLESALAIEKMQDEIAEILTPDQRTKFEALIAQQRARLEEFRKARGQWGQQGGPQGGPEAAPTPTPK
jgi:hypothetical protein